MRQHLAFEIFLDAVLERHTLGVAKVGTQFYRYEPPRPLEIIETDIKKLEGEILDLLKEVTA